jgi:hypothetical protein
VVGRPRYRDDRLLVERRVELFRAVDFLAVPRRAVDFRAVDFRAVDFRAVDFFAVDDFRADDFFAVDRLAVERFAVERFAVERFAVERFAVLRFRPPAGGTRAPFSRASESPIAIACLRLVTVRPFPPPRLPLFSVPALRRLIALSTVLLAPRLYLRPPDRPDVDLVAIWPPCSGLRPAAARVRHLCASAVPYGRAHRAFWAVPGVFESSSSCPRGVSRALAGMRDARGRAPAPAVVSHSVVPSELERRGIAQRHHDRRPP